MTDLSVIGDKELAIVIPENRLVISQTRGTNAERLVKVAKGGAAEMGRMVERGPSRNQAEHVKQNQAQEGVGYDVNDPRHTHARQLG